MLTLIVGGGKVKVTVGILMLLTCLFIAKNHVVCVKIQPVQIHHLDVLFQIGKAIMFAMMITIMLLVNMMGEIVAAVMLELFSVHNASVWIQLILDVVITRIAVIIFAMMKTTMQIVIMMGETVVIMLTQLIVHNANVWILLILYVVLQIGKVTMSVMMTTTMPVVIMMGVTVVVMVLILLIANNVSA